MASRTGHSLNICGVLSETKRIISAHSRHFLFLSVLFLLPLSFSLIIYPTLHFTLSHQSNSFQQHIQTLSFFLNPQPDPDFNQPDPDITKSSYLLPVLYSVFFLLFSLFATASITYSTFHGFYGRPVKIVHSVKSILFSFLPLVATNVVYQVILGFVLFVCGLFVVLVFQGLRVFFWVKIDYDSTYFLGFVIFTIIVIGVCLVYLQVEWSLVNVVVVVESQWGFAPLRRSSYLVKGMRGVALSLSLLFSALIGILASAGSKMVLNAGGVNGEWVSWVFILQTVVYSGFITILMLYSVASYAVLYMYCKALHGELAFEIAEEFAREYVSLPFDDGKVPHVVYVVPN